MERSDHQCSPAPEPESASSSPLEQPLPHGEPPAAISYRQLQHLLQRAAVVGPAASPAEEPPAAGSQRLELLLEHYGRLSQQLLEELASQGEQLRQRHSGRQLMALGALATHLQLGLQALAASRR